MSAEAKELKKRQALERQAKVMASFKAQQNSFMARQGLDLEADDFSDMDEDTAQSAHTAHEEKTWEFPAGSCMLCQEDTDDKRLYGTFAFIGPSRILRQTPVNDADFVAEVIDTPASLDRSADAIRPFGVASSAKEVIQKVSADGSVMVTERQGLSKGFPKGQTLEGPVVTSCGHLMHFNCFEAYMAATQRRHATQIARNHPERPDSKEFLCPLCKALGNTFLPIVWKDKQYSFPGAMAQADNDFDNWLEHAGPDDLLATSQLPPVFNTWRQGHLDYMLSRLNPTLATTLPQLIQDTPTPRARARSEESTYTGFSDADETAPHNALLDRLQRTVMQLSGALPSAPVETREQVVSPAEELRLAFVRMEEGMRPNKIIGAEVPLLEPGTQSSGVQSSEALAKALAYTISSVEIAHRGVATPEGVANATLLDSVPEQTLTTLKILSETVSSVSAQAATRPLPVLGADARVHRSWYTQLGQLIGVNVMDETVFSSHSLLENDLFVFFASCSLNELPMGQDMHHVLRLCYTAEIFKVLLTYLGRESFEKSKPTASAQRWTQPIEAPFARFQQWIAENGQYLSTLEPFPHPTTFPNATTTRSAMPVGLVIDTPHETPWPYIPLSGDSAAVMEALIDRYSLAFLRKTLLLLHIRFGVDFSSSTATIDPSLPELTRLATILRLPQPFEIIQQLGTRSPSSDSLCRIVSKWAVASTSHLPFNVLHPGAQSLSHPTIFELIGLPKNYDALTEEATRRHCPTTGKDLVDPALCLFCGEIFCSQAGCCMVDRSKGGCYQHRAGCGGSIGVFISIRKCMVLFLHETHGSWFHAPYLDRHGEVDPTLRRHHQLFLNAKRYDKLIREAVLGAGVQSVISRRLEGDMNTGGWETL